MLNGQILFCEATATAFMMIKNNKKKRIVSQKRKRVKQLRVPVLDEEKAEIEANAERAGYTSVAAYLRVLGLGYTPPSAIDLEHLEKAMKINADMARLGNLLLMWLNDDEKVAHLDQFEMQQLITRIDVARFDIRDEVIKALTNHKRTQI